MAVKMLKVCWQWGPISILQHFLEAHWVDFKDLGEMHQILKKITEEAVWTEIV